jgi:hypothetical protein
MNISNTDSPQIATSTAAATPLAPRVWRMLTFGDRLGRRAAVVAWLAVAVGLGLFFGWSVVVAAGLSTLVLSILPCAAMCALGLCAGSSGKRCSADKHQSTENPR